MKNPIKFKSTTYLTLEFVLKNCKNIYRIHNPRLLNTEPIIKLECEAIQLLRNLSHSTQFVFKIRKLSYYLNE